MSNFTIKFENGKEVRLDKPVLAGDLLESPADKDGLGYIACLVNNEVCSLSYPLEVNSFVKFITMSSSLGMRVYRDSLAFLLAKAVSELFPKANFMVQHSLGTGLYCTFEAGNKRMLRKNIADLESRMRELTDADLPVERRKIAFADAVEIFKTNGQIDKLNLLRFKNPQKVTMHFCGGFSDLAHAPLVSRTGMLPFFKLIPYSPGLVLQMPDKGKPGRVSRFRDQPHLFNIFQEHKEWGRILGLNTVGKLNEIISLGRIGDFIRIAEALQEKKIAQIADQILEHRNKVKIILVSGPSASGKTTFLKRLAIQLMVNGIRTVGLSLDNYYVDDADNPRDENGRPDYEHLNALDVELFNAHLLQLFKGDEVSLPMFDFQRKKRVLSGEIMKLENNQMLIVEGIHGLNPELTHMIPARNKFKIYISALTQLNIDSNNRIPTTDNRIMRRMIRDNLYRGNSALRTLRMWPSVRRGEKQWIFPHQKRANAVFNSALDYELAIIKPLVEPLLMEVKPADPEYAEARRLLGLLKFFLDAPKEDVPQTSILREFIGSSGFVY